MSLSVRPLPGSLVREFQIFCYMYDCFINHFPFFPTSLSNSTKLLFDIEKFFIVFFMELNIRDLGCKGRGTKEKFSFSVN